ncbi:MAG: thiol peroxidase [Candidatus Odinarchaeota archaeon]
MEERKGIITGRGNPLTLIGPELAVGSITPDFEVIDTEMKVVTLKETGNQLRIFSTVPSLDTPVCDIQTRKFNEEAKKKTDVIVYTFSMDLPYAQKRWCGAAGVEHVVTLSDYRERSFGLNYGLLIKESKLLARAVLIIDENNILKYIQIVPEITREPDYEAVLQEL